VEGLPPWSLIAPDFNPTRIRVFIDDNGIFRHGTVPIIG
jgi:hypothetical protein